MNRKQIRFSLLVGLCVSFAVVFPTLGYLQIPDLETLVNDSDLICTGKVLSKTVIETQGPNVFIQAKILSEKVFKGAPFKQPEIDVVTLETDKKSLSKMEDPVQAFPEKDSRVLLFLKADQGDFIPVSPRTGVYKIIGKNRLLPFARFSLKSVENLAKTEK